MATSTLTVPPAALELDEIRPHVSVTPPPKHDVKLDEEAAVSPPNEEQPPDGVAVATAGTPVATVKTMIVAVNYCLFFAGVNDASTGALIPYLRTTYDVGLLFVALVYLLNFVGWTVAAATNVHLTARIGMSGVLVVGATLQIVAYALMCWKPPYPVFVLSFFISGIGLAYQDAQTNAFVGNVQNAHFWLGLLHASYGSGALVSPLIATAIATHTPKWYYFYFCCLGLGIINLTLLSYSFWSQMGKPVAGAKETANKDLKRTVSDWKVLLLSVFFFLNVGTEVTAGGWVVTFLIEVRGGAPASVGYVASGFWGGLTLGRLILPTPTNRFGERKMVSIYIFAALICQFIFWFAPNIIADAVMISLLGFFIAPFFPTGISLATKLLPREQHVAAIGFIATVGQAGSAAFPFMTGAIAAKAGVKVLQPILVGLLAAQLVVWAVIPKPNRRTAETMM